MGNIKKLAGQTVWYGASTIAARFINYLLTPYLTYSSHIKTADMGKMAMIYSTIPVFNVLFTYGFETAYFRFSSRPSQQYPQRTIYCTACLSIIATTVVFSTLLWFSQDWLSQQIGLAASPDIVSTAILIVACDAITAIPFASLRQQNRPIKFAIIKITGILANICCTWFLVSYCTLHSGDVWIEFWFDPSLNPIVYVVFANLVQSALTLFMLYNELSEIKNDFNKELWKEMGRYALPLIIVGLGGIVNETFDRIMLHRWLPGTEEFREEQVGIYNACYKLSIFVTLFVQAFKMGAEPFFFKQAESAGPERIYARVMKFFVITLCFMYLSVSLFLPFWQYMVGPKYRSGLSVVPILLMANIFLGIYYNLSVWYKLGNKTIAGTYITLVGAGITILVNFLFIPRFGYVASAWATFLCYGGMMVVSYVWGQREYKIPYAWKKLLMYLLIVNLFFFIHKGITLLWDNIWFSFLIGGVFLFLFTKLILLVERNELIKLGIKN